MGPRNRRSVDNPRRASISVVAPLLPAALAAACSVAGSTDGGAGAGVGRTLPAIGLSGGGPALVWVLTAAQCLGCELGEAARVVRLLQRRFGERIETVVVAVGEDGPEDSKLVSAFLASQRIAARVEARTLEQYLRDFGMAPLPVLYVANREAVIEAEVAAGPDRTWGSVGDRRELAGFVEEITNIVNEGVAPAEEGSGVRQ